MKATLGLKSPSLFSCRALEVIEDGVRESGGWRGVWLVWEKRKQHVEERTSWWGVLSHHETQHFPHLFPLASICNQYVVQGGRIEGRKGGGGIYRLSQNNKSIDKEILKMIFHFWSRHYLTEYIIKEDILSDRRE
ncbi:hypothetical protein SUGI_0513680 [Cryptomeria japonica]|nr:hypothetical protein SUGI_0513680 [Cryptomeria japonica]